MIKKLIILIDIIMLLLIAGSAKAKIHYPSYIYNMDKSALINIYNAGVASGNQPGVFAKIGDSNSINGGYFLVPVGDGLTNFGQYYRYEETVAYYRQTPVREGNSFNQESKATISGLTASSFSNPDWIGYRDCAQTLLLCEYSEIHPTISFILVGTNDAFFQTPDASFEASMRYIIEHSLQQNIVPVLSTLPRRLDGRNTQRYDVIIIRLAEEYDVPWIDLRSALENLPNYGIDTSAGVHLSFPADGTNTANFTRTYLEYGHNVRNILTIAVLDQFRKCVAN